MTQPLYYAQNREDKWIAENLPLPEKGFYVDIGAGHPFITSNTAFLRDRKWEGLAIDGNRAWAESWKDIPAFVCAVISLQPEVVFHEDPDIPYVSRIGNPASPVSGEHSSVRLTTTIEELLLFECVGKIDFLSVDTEGTELEILQSFDFGTHEPPIVIVEYNAAHLQIVSPSESPIPDFMFGKGYSLKHTFPPINMVFAK